MEMGSGRRVSALRCWTMIDHRLAKQLWRFGAVGLGTNLLGYSVYLALTYIGLAPKIAMTGLYAIGAGLSFILNRRWTFAHKGKVTVAGFRFALAHMGGFALNYAMLAVLHDHLGWPHQLVQALAIGVVATFLFMTFRLFVFPERSMP